MTTFWMSSWKQFLPIPDSVYEQKHVTFVFLGLAYLVNMLTYNSIHCPVNNTISSFMSDYIYVYRYTYICVYNINTIYI
jgi:hypothetical protein